MNGPGKSMEVQNSSKKGFDMVNYLPGIGDERVRAEILGGLQASPKYILPKYFYDEAGSALFEAITGLDEYYPTRTEKKILSTIANKLNLDFSGLSIIELGSGDSSKISILLRQIPESELSTMDYYPVDISKSAIEQASKILADEFPMIGIHGIVADFMHQIDVIPAIERQLFCFFGSTIGNLDRPGLMGFMEDLGKCMRAGDSLLLGMDMVKDPAVLERAYNDEQQLTAAFNRNIINVINSLLGTTLDPTGFDHLAVYNKKEKRIEMYLKAVKDMVIDLDSGGNPIHIRKGEKIHTENSHKFDTKDIEIMGSWAGLDIEEVFQDDNHWFSMVFYKKNK